MNLLPIQRNQRTWIKNLLILSALALSKLLITPEKELEGKKTSEVLSDPLWNTNFWLYWQDY